MKTKLTATKAMTYATRRLTAGDVFEAPRRDAQFLVRLGRAQTYRAPEPKPEEDDLDALRVEAEGRSIDIDRRWGAKRLREEIAKARGNGE